MTYLRHASRHVHASVLDAVKDSLSTLGWLGANTLPFGPRYAALVNFTDAPAIDGDRLAVGIAPGTIAVTLGPEFPTQEQEIGGPTTQQDYPIFFDVFQPTYAAATALANDIRDTLMGRFDGTHRFVTVKDYSGDAPTPVDGWTCELTDIQIIRPEIRLPLHWQVVKVTAEVQFPEVQW